MRVFKLVGFIIAVGMLSFISSCKPKEPKVAATPSFTLKMKAKYGNQPFALNSPNIDSAGRYIVMSSLQFYLSHISLVKTDGSKVSIADAAVFNFSDTATLLLP